MEQKSSKAILCADIAIAVNALSALSSMFLLMLIQEIMANGPLPEWITDLSDIMEIATGWLATIFGLAFFIIFIIWLRAAYGNLQKKTGLLKYSVGWSVGGWFVPVWNLFRPYQVVKDLFVRTNYYISSQHESPLLSTSVITLWWTFYIITAVIGRISWQATQMVDPETGEGFLFSTVLQLIGGILNVAFYVYAKKVVREYSKAETNMA